MLVGDSFTNDTTFDWAGKVDYSPEFDVDYFSVPGRTLATMADLFGEQYVEGMYDGIVIAGGVNDAVGGRTAEQMQASVESIISETDGERIILTTIAPFRGVSTWTQTRQDNADQFDAWVFSKAAADPNISVFDICSLLDLDGDQIIDDEFGNGDGLHPRNCPAFADCGQEVVASSFISQFGEPLTTGDFNFDGVVDGDDLDEYIGQIPSGVFAFESIALLDLDGDNSVRIQDANMHIRTLVQTTNGQVGTFRGDLNLDGRVNVVGDAFMLISNLGNSVTSYAQGDINFDGTVSVLQDAFELISNIGMSNESFDQP